MYEVVEEIRYKVQRKGTYQVLDTFSAYDKVKAEALAQTANKIMFAELEIAEQERARKFKEDLAKVTSTIT